jgi:hypothetical protein
MPSNDHPPRLVDPRQPQPPPDVPADPRPLANPDLIAMERRRLLNGEKPLAPRHTGDSGSNEFADDEYLAYRYTRDRTIAVEDMGYGEKLNESFWSSSPGAPVLTRSSQRTRTARQRLSGTALTQVQEFSKQQKGSPSG